MADEYIRKQDAFDAVEARIAELMTHPEFRRKHLDIDLSGVIRNISAIKPADVAPIRHSRWIKTEDGAECEKCGREAVYQIVDDHWEYEPWCPHCGSKMDGHGES